VAVNAAEQLSLTLAVPKALLTSVAVGLHCGTEEAEVTVITGLVVSLVKLTVWEAVPVLPQASVTVHVLVTEWVHPDPVSAPNVPVAVKPEEQLSVTLAVPKALSISVAVGLHIAMVVGEVSVITGLVVSLVKLTVCEAVPVLPHASVTVHVLVTECMHPDPVSAPNVPVAVSPAEQLSVTLAVPNALPISVADGLHIAIVEAGVRVMTGLEVSFV
jgi:hypothetical protein